MDYFRHLRTRLRFPAMQYHCRRLHLPTAQGWERLEEKLAEACDESPAKRRAISQTLMDVFKDTIPLGHRVVQLFQLNPEHWAAVSQYLARIEIEDSPYATTYPAPLSTLQLASAPSGAFLTEVRKQENSVTLIFCAKRLIEEREQRSRSDIGTQAITQFGWQDYDEFILIRRRQIQAYEVVRFDCDTGLVEVRVEDHIGLDFGAAMNEVRVRTNAILASRFRDTVQLINPINLFPAIHPIYSDDDEGIVVELGFTTQTGSAKHEKMRQRSLDLREELFHVGGKNAIHGALTPFRIAVRWSATADRGQEEVILPGSIRQLGTTMPWLDHMVVKGPVSEAHMRECIERVVGHIPEEE